MKARLMNRGKQRRFEHLIGAAEQHGLTRLSEIVPSQPAIGKASAPAQAANDWWPIARHAICFAALLEQSWNPGPTPQNKRMHIRECAMTPIIAIRSKLRSQGWSNVMSSAWTALLRVDSF